MRPSLVERPDFLAACASPRLRRMVVASSRSPLASWRAALHSIMPAPVRSRSCLDEGGGDLDAMTILSQSRARQVRSGASVLRGRRARRTASLGLLEPGRDDRRRGRRGVRARPWRRAAASAACGRFGDAAAREHRVGDAGREQPDRAQRVVVARNDVVDFVRIAVGVDDADHRNLELARLVDGDLLVLGVDDEDRVGQAAPCRGCRRGSSRACGAPSRAGRFPSSTACRSGRRSSSPRARAGARGCAESS